MPTLIEQTGLWHGNAAFHRELKTALEQTADILSTPSPHLILDFGGDALSRHPISLLERLRQDGVTVYDPEASDEVCTQSKVRLTNLSPTGNFDIVLCHFSLHHTKLPPSQAIEHLMHFHPRLVVIADYDYTTATVDQFQETFVGIRERAELTNLFNGDTASCFLLHRAFSCANYQEALTSCRFSISTTQRGRDIARYKYFIIAKQES